MTVEKRTMLPTALGIGEPDWEVFSAYAKSAQTTYVKPRIAPTAVIR